MSARIFRRLRLRNILAATCALTTPGHLLLALSDSVWLCVLAFTVSVLFVSLAALVAFAVRAEV